MHGISVRPSSEKGKELLCDQSDVNFEIHSFVQARPAVWRTAAARQFVVEFSLALAILIIKV